MELYQLKYFLYASKYENISKAAQELRVAQPSVSKAIQALEKELQVELFERNGKRLKLTYTGRVLREKVSQVIWKLDELPDELGNGTRGPYYQIKCCFCGYPASSDY